MLNKSKNIRVPCPFCAESIPLEAKKCRFCNSIIIEEKIPKAIKNSYIVWLFALIYFLIAVIFSWIFDNSGQQIPQITILIGIIVLSGSIAFLILAYELLMKLNSKAGRRYGLITISTLIAFLIIIFYLNSILTKFGVLPSSTAVLMISTPIASNRLQKITPEAVINAVNQQRVNINLKPLANNEKLDLAAQAKVEDMCANNYWSHIAPNGTTPWHFINKAGYNYITAGENLARDYSDVATMILSWMDSVAHKENIVNRFYKETGVGIKECILGGVKSTVVVQLFGNPSTGRTSYDQIEGNGTYVNPNTPVHCPINSLCGGGSTPLTYAECQNSTCCKLDNGWTFYKDKSQCAQKQKEQGLISLEGNGVELDGYTDPNKPVHCSISPKCGGGTTPLTYAECQNSICCHTGDKYIFMKDRSQCK